jgi:hypothetical protein
MDGVVDAVAESVARRWEALRPHLTERQRRLWLGSEARELGSGGAERVAVALGVAADTVRRGRAELDNPEIPPPGRSRKPGGGRKRAEEQQPGLERALDALVEPTIRGDSITATSSLPRALDSAGAVTTCADPTPNPGRSGAVNAQIRARTASWPSPEYRHNPSTAAAVVAAVNARLRTSRCPAAVSARLNACGRIISPAMSWQ